MAGRARFPHQRPGGPLGAGGASSQMTSPIPCPSVTEDMTAIMDYVRTNATMEELLEQYAIPANRLYCSMDDRNLLGKGGMASVYQGQLYTQGQLEEVAVKVICLENASELKLQRAKNELAVMCRLSQRLGSCVIELKGFVEFPGQMLSIAMELCDCSLQQWMCKFPSNRLPLDQWVEVAIQVADCLRRMHKEKVIHRDVSTGNVLRSHGGIFKMADFGIAHLCYDALEKPNTHDLAGNVAYMAPEQGIKSGTISGPGPHGAPLTTSHLADVWAFGATMLHAWTGQLPYRTSDAKVIISNHRSGRPPNLAGAPRFSQLPAPLQLLLSRCLEISPRSRPTAHEVFVQLQRYKTNAKILEPIRELPPFTNTASTSSEADQDVVPAAPAPPAALGTPGAGAGHAHALPPPAPTDMVSMALPGVPPGSSTYTPSIRTGDMTAFTPSPVNHHAPPTTAQLPADGARSSNNLNGEDNLMPGRPVGACCLPPLQRLWSRTGSFNGMGDS